MLIKSTAYVVISLSMSTAYVVMKTSPANVLKLGILSPANVVIGVKRKKKLKKTYKMLIKSTAYVVISLRISTAYVVMKTIARKCSKITNFIARKCSNWYKMTEEEEKDLENVNKVNRICSISLSMSTAYLVIGMKRKKKLKKTYKMIIKSPAYIVNSLMMLTAYVVMKKSTANVVKLWITSPADIAYFLKKFKINLKLII